MKTFDILVTLVLLTNYHEEHILGNSVSFSPRQTKKTDAKNW